MNAQKDKSPLRVVLIISTRSDPNFLKPLILKLGYDSHFHLTLVSFLDKDELPPYLDNFEVIFLKRPAKKGLIGTFWGRLRRFFYRPKSEEKIPWRALSPSERRLIYARKLEERTQESPRGLKWRTRRFFNDVSPDIVISMDAWVPLLDDILLGAQLNHIPTLNIQHGSFFGWDELERKWLEFFPFDYVAIWGNYAERFLVQAGCPARRLLKIGSLSFDEAGTARDPEFRLKILRLYGIEADAKTVLLVMSPFFRYLHSAGDTFCHEEGIHAWYEVFCTALRENPELVVIVKPHPTLYPESKDCRTAREHLRGVPNRVIWRPPQENIWSSLAATDLAISYFSSVDFQALVAKRQVVVIKPPGFRMMYDSVALDAIPVVEDSSELSRLFSILTNGQLPAPKAAESFLEDHLGPRDCGASERLRQAILTIRKEWPAQH